MPPDNQTAAMTDEDILEAAERIKRRRIEEMDAADRVKAIARQHKAMTEALTNLCHNGKVKWSCEWGPLPALLDNLWVP